MSSTARHVDRVAIAGFTGRMARMITDDLLQLHPNVTIHGICRSPDKVDAKLRSHPNVGVFQAASDDEEALREALVGVDVCICAYLGDNDLMIQGQKTLIDACVAAGVPRYIASDWSLDYRGLKVGDHPAKDPMIITADYLAEKEKAGEISGVHVLCGAFTEIAWAPWSGWADAKHAKFSYYGTGDEPLEMTKLADAALFTAEAAYDTSAKGYLTIRGDKQSVEEMAQTFAQIYGEEPEVECKGSLDDLYKSTKETFKKDPANIRAWLGPHYQYYMGNGSTLLREPLANERYSSFQPKSNAQFLKEHSRDTVGMAYVTM